MKEKNSSRRLSRGMIILIFLAILILIAIQILLFVTSNRPTDEEIETQFTITLPENARDLGYWTYSGDGNVILSKFTVDESDLESTLKSVQYKINECIGYERTPDYMPDFYTDNSIEWWNPYNAQDFDGVSCYFNDSTRMGPNFNVMVDHKPDGSATVYIELYSTNKGKRALRD